MVIQCGWLDMMRMDDGRLHSQLIKDLYCVQSRDQG